MEIWVPASGARARAWSGSSGRSGSAGSAGHAEAAAAAGTRCDVVRGTLRIRQGAIPEAGLRHSDEIVERQAEDPGRAERPGTHLDR